MRVNNDRRSISDRTGTHHARNASIALNVLFQGRWRIDILCAMQSGPVRVGQLSRLIPGASKKMLAQNLRRLEADGIVVRRDLSDMVLHVEYDLADETKEEIGSLLDHLAQWGRWYALSRAMPSEGNSLPSMQRSR